MNDLYITSLGMAATFNGGLTNSAISRITNFANNNNKDIFYIHYCYANEKTEKFENFFRDKYDMPKNVHFLNAHDEIKDKKIKYEIDKNKKSKYLKNGKEISYFEYVTDSLSILISKTQYKNCYLFLDTVFSPDYRLNLTNKNLQKIFICHNEHIQYKENKFRHWKKNHYKARGYFQPIQDPYTKVVFLTELQKRDVEKREGNLEKFHCIPHFFEPKKVSNIVRENKISVVSRLATEKKILQIIKVFKLSKLTIPLEIWGNGPQKKEIEEYINENNINNVKLMGFTSYPEKVFLSSKLTISFSKFESFGLSILESMAYGCPVMSTKVLYGPLELIQDNITGFFIDENEKLEVMAQKLKQYFAEEKFNKFSKELKKEVTKYQYKMISQKWKTLFEQKLQNEVISEESKNIFADIKKNKLIIRIPKNNINYALRIYNKDLDKYEEKKLKFSENNFFYSDLHEKILSITSESKSEFQELEMKLNKKSFIYRVLNTPIYSVREEWIYNKKNERKKFKYIEFKNENLK